MAPGQSSIIEDVDRSISIEGWALYFHPDLIRRSSLSGKMKEYTFFSYSVNEALHISQRERDVVQRLVEEIQWEYSSNIDDYTHELINSTLELFLNYSKRFYNRQFLTRQNLNKDIVERFEEFLYERINSSSLKTDGIPTVRECAGEMCLSPNYLSDLLKKETGKNTHEHIQDWLM